MGKNRKERRSTPLAILTKSSFLRNANSSGPSPFNCPQIPIPVAGENLCSLDFFLQSIQASPTFYNMIENPMINNWISSSPASLSNPFVQPPTSFVNSAPSLLAPPTQINKPVPLLSISPSFINPIKLENKQQSTTETLKKIPKQKDISVPVQTSKVKKSNAPFPVKLKDTFAEISISSKESNGFTEEIEQVEESTSDIQGDIIYRRFRPNKSLPRQRNK